MLLTEEIAQYGGEGGDERQYNTTRDFFHLLHPFTTIGTTVVGLAIAAAM